LLTLTLKETLKGLVDTNDHLLYMYKDEALVFYFGCSVYPLDRLQEHLGQGKFRHRPTPLGVLILSNLPGSLSWSMEMFTLHECVPFVAKYRPEDFEWYRQQRERGLILDAAEIAEEALIEYYHPCLNIVNNSFGPILPEKYHKSRN
jgi:hypothetical protein